MITLAFQGSDVVRRLDFDGTFCTSGGWALQTKLVVDEVEVGWGEWRVEVGTGGSSYVGCEW